MKKLFLVLMACFIIVSASGCGSKPDDVKNEKEAYVVEVSGDYMEKYIANLPTDDDRTDFLSFWNSITSYCGGLEYKLSEIENTVEYAFDPSNSESIPDELKEVYSFSTIKFFKGFATHKDFEMKISGETVELSFDGEIFYPTNYGYSDVQSIIEKYNAE